MAYLVGTVSALAVFAFARWLGLDRDRAFYPTVLAVIACLYSLFGVLGGSQAALVQEMAAGLLFIGLVVIGFKRNLWFIVCGLALHGVFDYVHGYVIADPGVPAFWPAFCGSYDVVAAAGLAWLILRGAVSK